MRIERFSTPNCTAGREGHTPRAVVVHTTDGSFADAADWFGYADAEVSAHYLVGLDGRIAQFVEEVDTARHAGAVHEPTSPLGDESDPNLVSIGIEFADDGRPGDVHRPDRQYRAGAELLAGIHDRWGIPLDRDHVVGHRELTSRKTCPGNLDIDRLLAEARALVTSEPVSGGLVCLLPARNAAADLPGWLAGVRGSVDAVVALDDGSTDETAALLEADPLVRVLLRNPRRESYAGWDDAANRNRLLDAAGELEPEWVLSLDADERIPFDDARALRDFVDTDALPGLGYGLQHFRQWGDGWDPDFRYVWRLFAWEEGQRFPDDRLHFNPVPATIPAGAYVATTLRLQHLGSRDESTLQARLSKYAEADPEGEWPVDWAGLATVPESVQAWEPRDRAVPVLVGVEPE